jgi:hypothetical protein
VLTWERHHHDNDLEWPLRPDGIFNGGEPVDEDCCLLLLSDTGAGTDELLLLSDTDETSCLELLGCEPPVPLDCCLLLLSDIGFETDGLLLLQDTDGTSCLELLSC